MDLSGSVWHVTANEVLSPQHQAAAWAPTDTPRPICSRVTTSDGRSPGSRISIDHRLPGKVLSSGFLAINSPLTVAGAAAASLNVQLSAFPFNPRREPSQTTIGNRLLTCQTNWARKQSQRSVCDNLETLMLLHAGVGKVTWAVSHVQFTPLRQRASISETDPEETPKSWRAYLERPTQDTRPTASRAPVRPCRRR